MPKDENNDLTESSEIEEIDLDEEDDLHADGITIIEPEESPEILELRAQNEDLDRRLRAISSAYQSQLDEMKAFKARSERLQIAKDQRHKGEIVMTMFEPAQNLRRSIESLKKIDLPQDVINGLVMVMNQFSTALEKLGLEEISGEGKPFDPNNQEALSTMMVTDPSLDGMVVQVFETGYKIGTQLIRPARVIIGRYQEPDEE